MATTHVPIVYINLDTAVERRRLLEQQCQTMGLSARRLNAIRWSSLTPEQQRGYYSAELNASQYHTPLVDGEKGCYASHMQAWQDLLAGADPCTVVLEDDVRLAPDFLRVVHAVAQLDMPWDMVKLIGRSVEKVASTRPLCEGVELVDYSRIPSYTAGYVVSRTGAQKMLATRQPFGRPIDVDIRFWWENELRVYGVWPPVLLHDETSQVSTIAGRHAQRSLSMRWKKLKMKFLLTAGNAWYRIHRKA